MPVQMRHVGPVGGHIPHAFVPQFTHVDLQCEKSEDHKAEYGQGHDLGQLAKGVQQCIDYSLQPWHYGHRFQRTQHTKRTQSGQIANLHANCRISTCYDHKVQPIPRITQIGIFVEQKAFGNDFDYHFN